jgi:hypothetical protein
MISKPLIKLSQTLWDLSILGLSKGPWHPLHKLAMYDRKSYSYVVWVIAQK